MKPRLYFDTSVFGGIYDVEFEKETKQLFQMVEDGEIVCSYSELTVAELENAPEKVKRHFQKILTATAEKVELTASARKLAMMYIRKSSRSDKP